MNLTQQLHSEPVRWNISSIHFPLMDTYSKYATNVHLVGQLYPTMHFTSDNKSSNGQKYALQNTDLQVWTPVPVCVLGIEKQPVGYFNTLQSLFPEVTYPSSIVINDDQITKNHHSYFKTIQNFVVYNNI